MLLLLELFHRVYFYGINLAAANISLDKTSIEIHRKKPLVSRSDVAKVAIKMLDATNFRHYTCVTANEPKWIVTRVRLLTAQPRHNAKRQAFRELTSSAD